jgi:hypothetical protein
LLLQELLSLLQQQLLWLLTQQLLSLLRHQLLELMCLLNQQGLGLLSLLQELLSHYRLPQ